MKFIIGVFVINKKNKNNTILETLPSKRNFKFFIYFSLKKLNNIITKKITNIYAVGVCIDKKPKIQI